MENKCEWPQYKTINCYKCDSPVMRCLMTKEGYEKSLKDQKESYYKWMCKVCAENGNTAIIDTDNWYLITQQSVLE